MPPKITIVTPSFNQAKYLEETIRSVVSQREYVHEYFVVDGGSTDGSVDVIKRYADRIDWWVSEKDKGQSDAIQKGFARATGDYIAWINSDDVYLPAALEKVTNTLSQNPQYDCVTGFSIWIDANSRVILANPRERQSRSQVEWGVNRISQPTWFFRRELYNEVGGLDLSLHYTMDVDLWYRMFAADACWGHVADYVSGFRQHAAAKTSSGDQKWARDRALMCQRYPQFPRNGLKWALGNTAYRLTHCLNGYALKGRRDTARWRGKSVSEVFGEWGV